MKSNFKNEKMRAPKEGAACRNTIRRMEQKKPEKVKQEQKRREKEKRMGKKKKMLRKL